MKTKKILVRLGLFICSFMLLTSCNEVKASGGDFNKIIETRNIVVGTNAEYSPFEYLDSKTNEVVGYDIDLVKLFAAQFETNNNIKLNVVIKDMPFDGLIGSMNAGTIDFIAAAFSKDEEREKTLAFSDVYYKAETVLVVKEDNVSVSDYNSLKGLKLGAQLGTVQESFAKEATEKNLVKALGSLATMTLDLKSNNVDALLVEKPVGLNICNKQTGFKIIDSISFPDDEGYGFATNIGNDKLINELNKFISTNKKNGKLDEMFIEALERSLNQETNINTGLDFGPVWKFFPMFMEGLGGTILFSLATIAIGSLLGFLLCLLRMSKIVPLSFIAKAYIAIVRGTPMLIQLFIFAYGIPMFFHLNIDLNFAGILALGLNSTAYVAEIFRSGIQAVDKGQFEGARAMGFSKNFTMRKIILPQAIKNVLPSIGNEFVTIVKESSIVSIIGIVDITRVSDLVKASSLRVLEPLLFAALLYFLITSILTYLIKLLERKLNRYESK